MTYSMELIFQKFKNGSSKGPGNSSNFHNIITKNSMTVVYICGSNAKFRQKNSYLNWISGFAKPPYYIIWRLFLFKHNFIDLFFKWCNNKFCTLDFVAFMIVLLRFLVKKTFSCFLHELCFGIFNKGLTYFPIFFWMKKEIQWLVLEIGIVKSFICWTDCTFIKGHLKRDLKNKHWINRISKVTHFRLLFLMLSLYHLVLFSKGLFLCFLKVFKSPHVSNYYFLSAWSQQKHYILCKVHVPRNMQIAKPKNKISA